MCFIIYSGFCGEYDTYYYGSYYSTEKSDLLKSYEELFNDFSKNISSREDSFHALFSASKSVFSLKDLSSGCDCRELLENISKQRISFNDIFLEISMIRSAGSDKDREACDMFERRFDKYVEGLACEYQKQVSTHVDEGCFLVEFIVDQGQHRCLGSEFKHQLVEHFSIPQESIDVKLSAVGGPVGGQVFLIQLPEKYSSSFILAPFYGSRIHALKNFGVQFVRYKEHEIFLSKWNLYSKQEITLGETSLEEGHNKVISVNARGSTCMAVQYTEESSVSAEVFDEGYIQYLESVLNHYHKNIPAVKGLCYLQGDSKHYPLLIIEDCLSLKLDPRLEFPFEDVCQVSFLLDLVNCIIEFNATSKLITLIIYANAVYICRRENRLEAKLCPLFGYTFLFDQAENPSVEDLHWMSVVTEYLQFGKDGQKLPESHVLKKWLYQKWLSSVGQRDYKELREDLCDLHCTRM